MNDLINIILLSILGSVIALIGGVVFISVKKWSQKLSQYSTPFAAGVMITVSLLGLLTESSHMIGDQAFLITLISFLGSYLFENFFCDLHHHDHENHDHDHPHCTTSAPLVIIGDTIHNFIDGIAIATSYLVNPGLGLTTTISTFLHEVPHEIGDFGILLKSGFSKTKVFTINFLSSLSTLLGVFFVWYLLPSDNLSGILLSIAAGMFLYLGASDFLPQASKGKKALKTTSIMLLGVILMYVTLNAIPHSHDHHEHEKQMHEDHYHEPEENHEEEEHDHDLYHEGDDH